MRATFPPATYADRFGVSADEALRGAEQTGFVFKHMRDVEGATAAEMATLIALYDAEVAFTDVQVGRILLELMARKVGPTIVVVTSDHGEEFGEHGGLQHSRTLFEELLRVPLIISGPGVPQGTTTETPVSLLDVWPLLADLTGVPAPSYLPSRSLRQLANGTQLPEPFFADLAVNWGIHTSAVVDNATKLIVDRNHEASLYDLGSDPGEQHDIVRQAATRTEAMGAILRIRQANSRTSLVRSPQRRSVLTPDRRARLRALGYIE